MNSVTASSKRLESLDILRGFDLFLLVLLQPVLVMIGRSIDNHLVDSILYQFDHEVWIGFRFWDLVMPLFLFMSGTSMPFSFSKYKTQDGFTSIHRKILRRFVILFLLGMIVQGNLLGLNLNEIYIYNNTLQAIAVGYLIAALANLHLSFRNQIVLIVSLLIVYSIPMMIYGVYSPDNSFAFKIDEFILGKYRGDTTYTWIWSSLTFGVTVLLGSIAGHIMYNGRNDKKKVLVTLFVTGISLVFLGYIWSFNMPIIKRIWTGSMTLLSGGYCFILMGLFYYWIDFKGNTRGLMWLKIYGMNSITAYVLGEVINFRSVADSVLYGFRFYLNDYYSVLLTTANYLIIFFILRWMYNNKIFIKI